MNSFAILRVQKLKAAVSVSRSLRHSHREQETPNADLARTPLNSAECASSAEALDRLNERLATQKHVRKNAVLAIEYFVGASPEVLKSKSREQQDAYFSDARRWLERRHGAENVIDCGVHRDETTPHLWAYVVPIDEKGKLNCRRFLGGAEALRDMQSDFAKQVGEPHGLERGRAGSKAKHERVSQYYARVNAAFKPLPIVKTPPPKPLRPAPPEKPWWKRVFMSSSDRAAYKTERERWLREKSAHDVAAKKRAMEIRARQSAAVEIARSHEAQASQAGALKSENQRLQSSAAGHAQETTRLRRFLSHFSPEEIAAAKRRQAEAEQRRSAEQAAEEKDRQAREFRERVAECESNLREDPPHANSHRLRAPRRQAPELT
ncbi:MAG: plasmid recombination protein [Rhodocyclales bacterium]|nr:plasmid recombination protein [Rhodocyclales bacterium]